MNFEDINWDGHHVLAYLCIAIAEVDLNRTEEEEEIIMKALDRRTGDSAKSKEIYKEVKQVISGHRITERPGMIKKLMTEVPLDQLNDTKVIFDLIDIVSSDESVSSDEHKMLNLIRANFHALKDK